MAARIVISGCSGGGKSTLLTELARRGYRTIEEPGRRVVREEQAGGGAALPWIDLPAFANRALALARADLESSKNDARPVFFDRGIVDAAAALAHADEGVLVDHAAGQETYCRTVFMTPPWRTIYRRDAERRHDFEDAAAEYDRLLDAYGALGFTIEELPFEPVRVRADHMLRIINLATGS